MPEKKVARKKLEDYSEVMRHERASDGMFSAFLPKPKHLYFEDQHENEKVVLVLRQHLFTQVKPFLTIVLMAFFVPFILNAAGFLTTLPSRFQFAFYLFWLVLIFIMFINGFLHWFFNVYIITDERIVDVDFDSMIRKNISSAKIENIEDVTANTSGFFASMFNYGSITIQTAGEKREFEFAAVPQPAKVSKLINELLLEEEREKLEGRVN